MRLASFSVKKYRSIIDAHRLPMASSTVLIGKNNEGKSNLLSGLSAAMEVVEQLGNVRIVNGRLRGFRLRGDRYKWERDFPVQLQDSDKKAESIFRLRFHLDQKDREEFHKEVGSKISDELPIEIWIGKGDPFFKVIKQGPGSKLLNNRRERVAGFIGRRVEFTYIPAVRTAQAAISVVRDMVTRALRELEEDPEYAKAVEKIAELQRPVLDQLGGKINESLAEFLPSVKDVRVELDEDTQFHAIHRSIEVIVDDGTPTSLERKGDGVQSLAAIGLLRRTGSTGRHLILGIEEPESHLHPSAIHRLRGVLRDLAREHQVVLTTHSPVFADRLNVGSNILVDGKRAKPASRIVEIREALGVRASDNLRHAEIVLVVEGISDVRVITALLGAESGRLKAALADHLLVVDCLHGSGKLSFKLSELRTAITEYHCLLDNDDAGRAALEKAQGDGLLQANEFHVTSPPSGADAELEDLLDQAVYEHALQKHLDIQLKGKPWRGKGKWSSRLAGLVRSQGKIWNSSLESTAKEIVASSVEARPTEALHGAGRVPIDRLIEALESRLSSSPP